MTNIPASQMVSLGINRLLPFFILLIGVCVAIPVHSQCLQEGDLLFTCSDDGNAITDVTSGVGNLPIDHVAMVHRIGGVDGLLFVIEAIKPTVCITPIDTFISNNPSPIIIGRVNVDFDVYSSVRGALMMVGKPYDDLFLPGDSAVYCSELVQINYVDNAGKLIFQPIPMSFHDASMNVTDYWKDFYGRRGMSVPEGEPGSNPGELSCREQVTIIGKYSR